MTAVEIGIGLFCLVGSSYTSFKIGVKTGASVLFDSFYEKADKITGRICLKFSDGGNTFEIE